MSLNQQLVKANGSSTLSFNTQVSGTRLAASALNVSGALAVDPGSLVANISIAITTTSLTLTARWEASQDGTTYNPIFATPGTAYAQVAPTGTGSPVTTNYTLPFPSALPSYPFVRITVLSGGATGGAADQAVISYNFLKRSYL